MAKGKILGIVFTQGTTVTLPQPVGSRSSLDCKMHGVIIEEHPRGVRILKPGMPKAVFIPDAQIKSWDEELTQETPAPKSGKKPPEDQL